MFDNVMNIWDSQGRRMRFRLDGDLHGISGTRTVNVSGGYTLLIASDVSLRDGLGVEFYGPSDRRIAEVFRDDTTGNIRFRGFASHEVPFSVMKNYLKEAESILGGSDLE